MYNVIVAGCRISGENKLGIGYRGNIPWKVPEDILLFKQITMGNIVIMGRKTWESIPERFRPLSGRTNIVITRSPEKYSCAKGTKFVSNIDNAFLTAGEYSGKIFIIGGESLYTEVIDRFPNLLAKLYLTTILDSAVNSSQEFDTYFPEEKYLRLCDPVTSNRYNTHELNIYQNKE
jgi:dihydrofolate reductase